MIEHPWKTRKLLAVVAAALLLAACVGSRAGEGTISRVERMPDLPRPYLMRDWQHLTRDYLNLVSDVERRGEHLPLMRWSDASQGLIWMPSFVGAKEGPESVNYLAAVVSGSLVGLDMRQYRGRDWVAAGTNFFSPDDGVFLNWPKGRSSSGESFWYDVFPNVLYFQLADLYPNDAVRTDLMQRVATRWYQAAEALGGNTNSRTLPDFDHTGFDLRSMRPRDNGRRIEPEGAAGIAWLEYMAWRKFNNPRYLTAADWAIRALEKRPVDANPLYEVLLPYAALTAGRMNAELGRSYDVTKLVNWCFDPRPRPQARPNWGVITGSWNGMDVDGLVGSATDGGGYAFAMNTFHYAGVLAPLARYDERFAPDLGKWLLNLANASRLFYANAHSAEAQSSHEWAVAHDPHSVIAYEGLRKWKRSSSATAMADYRTAAGRIVQGDYTSTRFFRDNPPDKQVLEETKTDRGFRLDHIWEFELPSASERFLVVAAERDKNNHPNNTFRFSFASAPGGPFVEALRVGAPAEPQFIQIPDQLKGKLYVRVESTEHSSEQSAPDQLRVDAMAISHQSQIGPYAQGDMIVRFVSLVKDATVPIVLYRPARAATDFSLYGSSHVGYLGGLVKPSNVEGILQVDLLRTDFFHGPAYPTFLYYNPHQSAKTIKIEVGTGERDIYDTVSNRFVLQRIRGEVEVTIPADSVRVLVLAPARGKLTRQGSQTLIDGVVVDYRDGHTGNAGAKP